MTRLASSMAAFVLGLVLMSYINHGAAQLQVGFYKGKCGFNDVEFIVTKQVTSMFFKDQTIAPALIRMYFHDCFVNGCDASILLDGPSSEKTAPPNLSVRGYEVIDQVKAELERVCPGLVSCADIITMATRDVVLLSKGGRYNVETGRRDGTKSVASDVNLPSSSMSVSQVATLFSSKGLTPTDMVYLLGAHTIGVTHCAFIMDRLYNFQNSGKPDPTMDSSLLATLIGKCPQGSTVENSIDLDQNSQSSNIVDNSFYNQILLHRGILQIDQELALDSMTTNTVKSIASGNDFITKFGETMVKLGGVQVLTGINQGEIRKSCRLVNSNKNNNPIFNLFH